MQKCANHPARFTAIGCKKCKLPICEECRLYTEDGVFCSEGCAQEFREFSSKIMVHGGSRSRFSFSAWIKHIATAAILVVVILVALYIWLGTTDPGEMYSQIMKQLKLLF
ncbi:MAG: hypothetical protein K1X53_16480 [Candidatus Sumerlaeaceae bacterium]|nr:hypothetical protein [Candidatus Sumerlaeaceae bacterium]